MPKSSSLSPNQIQLERILVPPGSASLLGYDDLGRSIGDRLLHGARTSFLVAAWVVCLSALLGTHGLVDEFPWLRYVYFTEQGQDFVSHHVGFHVLIFPFVQASYWLTGDYLDGGRWAMCTFLGLNLVLFNLLLHTGRVPWRWLWYPYSWRSNRPTACSNPVRSGSTKPSAWPYSDWRSMSSPPGCSKAPIITGMNTDTITITIAAALDAERLIRCRPARHDGRTGSVRRPPGIVGRPRPVRIRQRSAAGVLCTWPSGFDAELVPSQIRGFVRRTGSTGAGRCGRSFSVLAAA